MPKCRQFKLLIDGENPIVISKRRFQQLNEHVGDAKTAFAQERAQELAKYQEYLKEGARDLMSKFVGNIRRSRGEKLQQKKRESEIRNQNRPDGYAATKIQEEKVRQERLVKAKEILEKLKPGPRELHRAAIESETMHARVVHQKICEDYLRDVKKQECLDASCETGKAGASLLEETPERVKEHQQRQSAYREALNAIVENRRKRYIAEKDQKLKEELAERARIDEEIKEQNEKERLLKLQKQNQCRNNLDECLADKEERLTREKMADTLDERLNCVFNTGQRQLNKLRKANDARMNCEIVQTRCANTKLIADILAEAEKQKQLRICNEAHCKRLTFPPEDLDPKAIAQKKQASKQELLNGYEMARKYRQQERIRAEEMIRYEMANRIKSKEINCVQVQEENLKRKISGMEQLESLHQQYKEHKCYKAAAELDRLAAVKDARSEKDDAFFFSYALQLMEDAYKKGRPLLPFAKAVDVYKRKNKINCSSPAVQKPKTNSTDMCEEEIPQEIIAKKCHKIEKLLALEKSKLSKDCQCQCPMDCFQHKVRAVKANGLKECLSVRHLSANACKDI